MEEVKKYIDFSYLIGGLILTWLAVQTVESIWGLFERLPNPELFADIALSTSVGIVIGVGVTIYLRMNAGIYTLMSECGIELKKTIWPGWAETKQSTLVVIVVVVILGFVLWSFDLVWKTATNLLYR